MRSGEDEWEERMFQEWEDREFEDAVASDLSVPTIENKEQVEFAIRELIAALANLVEVVDMNIRTYDKMVPATLHAALMTVMDEIAEWSMDA